MCWKGDIQGFAGNTPDPTSASPPCMPSETWSQCSIYLSYSVSIYKMGIICYSQNSVGLMGHACKSHNPGSGTEQVLNSESDPYSWD